MKKLRTYTLALALGLTSVGALSSTDVPSDSHFRKYAIIFSSSIDNAMRYVSTSIDAVLPATERTLTHVRPATAAQEDANILGTLAVVTFIAGFAIVRRLG